MTMIDRRKAEAGLRAAAAAAVDAPTGRRFRVVLEGVKAAYETPDSFAIKFGIAINQPVTKVKHLLRSLPSVIWEGENPTMAAGLLSLIDEAGGQGRIDEVVPGPAPVSSPSPGPPESKTASAPEQEPPVSHDPAPSRSCPKCGFPAREGDRYCQFCMSSLNERPKVQPPEPAGSPPPGRSVTIPPKRLLVYVSVVLIALIVHLILSR